MRLTSPSASDAWPLDAAEFDGLMNAAGPFGPTRRVVVGVSGGADSMALAWLLRRWGAPLAVVVDHGLRPGSDMEAAWTVAGLAAFDVPAQLVRLRVAPGPGVAARARAARYHALLSVCAAEGVPDLLVAHHAADQAETVVLRTRSGSGVAGRAGMALVRWCGPTRLLRPLLGVSPGRLRATLRAAGVSWVEDPTNVDPSTARGALRQSGRVVLPPEAETAGQIRREAEQAMAAELARSVSIHPGGYAEVEGRLGDDAWSALIWTVSGRPYPPPAAGVRRLAAAGRGTLHGVRVADGVVMREAAAMAPAVAAEAGAVWDGRFVLYCAVPGATLGALGDEAAGVRRLSRLPAAVLKTLPALRLGGDLFMIPHLDYPRGETCLSVHIGFRPARPLGGAAFVPAIVPGCVSKGMRMGESHPMS